MRVRSFSLSLVFIAASRSPHNRMVICHVSTRNSGTEDWHAAPPSPPSTLVFLRGICPRRSAFSVLPIRSGRWPDPFMDMEVRSPKRPLIPHTILIGVGTNERHGLPFPQVFIWGGTLRSITSLQRQKTENLRRIPGSRCLLPHQENQGLLHRFFALSMQLLTLFLTSNSHTTVSLRLEEAKYRVDQR